MKTWLDKLIEPLENPKYKQIKGKLVEYDDIGQIVGKCAEGEIACQNNIKYKEDQLYLSPIQLQKLGIPEDLITGISLPYLSPDCTHFDFSWTGRIGDYIFLTNDAGFAYDQIIEFLRTTFEDAV